MSRYALVSVMVMAAAAAAADPAPAAKAALQAVTRPDGPWTAAPSGQDGQFVVKWTVALQETKGSPVTLEAVRLLAEDVVAAEKLEMPALDADAIRKLARTTEVEAGGKLELPLRFYFEGPRRHLKVRVEIDGRDAEGTLVRVETAPTDIR